MVKMAGVLKSHIMKQNLYTQIANKNYAHVEGWQFAGGLMGLFPIVTEVKDLSSKDETKWQATVEIQNVKDGKIMARGFAICSNKENKKRSFDEYAILSMAQTRAIGKAYRNLIGWVMKLAGYEGTPSEEMVKVGDRVPESKAPDLAQNGAKQGFSGPETECHACGNPMTSAEANFSKRIYGKQLCRGCQAEAKRRK
jgi:hypothetical protein